MMRTRRVNNFHSINWFSVKVFKFFSASALLVLLTSCTLVTSVQQTIVPPMPGWNEYAAKFACGTIPPSTSDQLLLNVGRYFTTVNVHNPSVEKDADLWYKATASRKPPELQVPSGFKKVVLKPDYGLQIDCSEIRDLVATTSPEFIEGWVVIMTPAHLDVAPIYTAGSTATIYPVQSIDVEIVNPMKIKAPWDLLGIEPLPRAQCPGGLGCCCNIQNRSTGQSWPACDAGFECRGWVPGPTPPSGPLATCTPIGRSPTFHAQLHSSQPPFCGNP